MYRSRIGLIYLLSLLVSSPLGATTLYDDLIGTTARHYGLEPAFVKAIVKCESNFDPNAISSQGAQGLMQLMPATQATLGVMAPFNPPQNIDGGSRYLTILQQTFGTTAELLLAAYNAGPQTVITSGYAVPNISETQSYITCVTQAWQDFQTQAFNQQYAHIPAASTQTASPIRAALQAPPTKGIRGRRLLLQLNAWNLSSDTGYGVVNVTYSDTHFSLVTLRTTAENITVHLPQINPPSLHPMPQAPADSPSVNLAYRFLQSSWPTWEAGQQQTATLALIPLLAQDIALHLSVVFYDHSRPDVQHRWSTVVRIQVKSN